MRLTRAQTIAGLIAGLLFASGAVAILVIAQGIQAQPTPSTPYAWQLEEPGSSDLIGEPPQVLIVPTSSRRGKNGLSVGGDREIGLNYSVKEMLLTAYGFPSWRANINARLPGGRFDFLSNLPTNSLQAFQSELQRKFHLAVTVEKREREVLQLKVKRTSAPGLAPTSSDHVGSSLSLGSDSGSWSENGQPVSVLIPQLELFFELPITDHTGLTNKYDTNVKWKRPFLGSDREAVRQAFLDQLGLELAPAKETIEVLVVEAAK